MDKERVLLQTKIQKLESLCRAQQERLRAQKSPPPAEECEFPLWVRVGMLVIAVCKKECVVFLGVFFAS